MNARFWIAGLAVVGTTALVAIRFPRPKVDAACCYFAAQEKDINQPGQKAFISWDEAQKIEAFTVQPKFEGNAVDFGMVVPTPGRPKLDEMPRDFFKDLAIYTILMPLPQPVYTPLQIRELEKAKDAMGGSAYGGSRRGVKVLESGVVGSLDYKIIVAEEANGLFDWLKENNYVYSGDRETLDFYIKKKWFFTVMKIDTKQMKKAADGSYLGDVTPTRFTFPSEQCVYPLKITQLSVKDKTDALFYVQAPKQMDLPGDLSWMHSYRVMYLTYMLGCSANADQQKELTERNAWMLAKKTNDTAYETTKLEWARKLGDAEIDMLDDPLKGYAQMGGGGVPSTHKAATLDDFLGAAKAEIAKSDMSAEDKKHVEDVLQNYKATYAPEKGLFMRVEGVDDKDAWAARFMWYPNREAPAEDVKGLSRLKGHLQKGQWLTKFRKILRKDEMTDDLVLVPVEAGNEQEYVRIMPTSPP